MTDTTSTVSEARPDQPPEHALIEFITELRNEKDKKLRKGSARGSLALLRGALSSQPERQQRAWRLLARFGGIPDRERHWAEVVRTVAGLMAHGSMQHQPGGKSFGRACTALLGDDEKKSLWKADAPGPVSRRVQHLLAASRDEICDRVCLLGRRLAVEGVALDFTRLLNDLKYWGDNVKARWAADFWGIQNDKPDTKGEKP